jgi:5'-3' exonuclease
MPVALFPNAELSAALPHLQMRLLRHFGVVPLLVFDGDRLPAKSSEEAERRERRAARQAAGRAHLAAGNRSAAEAAFQSAIDITPAMAREVMDGLAAEGFDFLVAPFEADAQLAHLARTGAVDIVATEDSDLAAYGAPVILFKLDKHGNGEELRMADVLLGGGGAEGAPVDDACDALEEEEESVDADADEEETPPLPRAADADADDVEEVDSGAEEDAVEDADEDDADADFALVTQRTGRSKRSGGAAAAAGPPERLPAAPGARRGALSFRVFDQPLFLCMCVLAGCDFLPSLRGVGIKRAHALAARARTPARLLALLRTDAKLAAPAAYLDGFKRAMHTFNHARGAAPASRDSHCIQPAPVF